MKTEFALLSTAALARTFTLPRIAQTYTYSDLDSVKNNKVITTSAAIPPSLHGGPAASSVQEI